MTFALAASSAAFFWDLRTNPAGSACRYWQFSPLGHSQNQPNFCVSIAWMKCLHTIYWALVRREGGRIKHQKWYRALTSVVVRGLPAFDNTTVRSFSSSQVSIVSIWWEWLMRYEQLVMNWKYTPWSFSSRLSSYKFFFSTLRPTLRSWLNLHFVPFSQLPAL